MSSLMGSHGLALAATAMAVSGTVVLLTLCRQKQILLSFTPLDSNQPSDQTHVLRPCLSSASSSSTERRRRERVKSRKKKVHFADQVEEFSYSTTTNSLHNHYQTPRKEEFSYSATTNSLHNHYQTPRKEEFSYSTTTNSLHNHHHHHHHHHQTPRKEEAPTPRLARAPQMPANRVALYNGILRDRMHRVQCSY